MTDIIILAKTEQIIIRLEIRLKIMFAIHTDFIFVCVDHICLLDVYKRQVLYRVKAFLQVCPIEFFLWNHLYSYIFSVLLNLIDVF